MPRTAILFLCFALAAQVRAAPFHTIAPGIVLDEARGCLYLMDRVGRLKALALPAGTVLWRSADPALPLGLSGGTLIALDGRKGAGGMRLLALDPEDGALRGEGELPMPMDVRVRARPGLADRFEVVADPAEGGLRLRWHYQRLPMRGAPAVADGDVAASSAHVRAGAIALSWDGAALALGTVETLPPDSAAFSARLLSGEGRIRDAGGLQRSSADGETVLVSEVTTLPHYGPAFRWRVFRRDGTPLGELTSHYGSAPFLVRDGLLLFRRDPLLLVEGDDRIIEQGSRLIAWDLAAGRERFSIDVAEQRYFGPAPP